MSPTLSFFLGLAALIPHAFPISVPATPARGLTNIISADFPNDNALPPSLPFGYKIPGTTLTIRTLPSPGPLLPSLSQTLACIAIAQADIAATIASESDIPIPRPTWHFTSSNIALAASSPFGNLGTYGRLSSALMGLQHLLTVPGGIQAVEVVWVLADDVLGIVMRGDVRAAATRVRVGVGSGSGTSATATASQSASIVAVEELDST